jgi:5-methylthioadenosine/S-adenosylhomocysteine deaminase
MTARTLLTGGTVLTLDRSVGNFQVGDVLIEDGRIAEVGPSVRARGAEIIDAADTIVMPGFVDTHRHLWHSLFRNSGAGAVTVEGVAPHFTADHVFASTLIGLLGAAEAGITTVVDWADIAGSRAFVEAALQAHSDAGLRTVFVAADPVPSAATRLPLSDIEEIFSATAGSRTVLAAGTPAPDPGDPGETSARWGEARAAGLRIHTHVGVDTASRGGVASITGSGLLADDITFVHCTNLDDADLDAIKDSGAKVSLAPSVEMTDGFGAPPLQGFIDRDIRPGLGVASEMEAPGDMFAQMRAANSLQHATLFDLKLAGKGAIPNLLTTRQVIRYGTIDGAEAIGLAASIGSLAPGKRADVVVLRADRPNIAPVNDPIGAVVWGMDTSNIDWVFVDGEAVVREGTLVADVPGVTARALTAHREVASAAGLLSEAGTDPS